MFFCSIPDAADMGNSSSDSSDQPADLPTAYFPVSNE